jgi:hypothetical protein
LDGETFWRHANKFLADDNPNDRKGVGEWVYWYRLVVDTIKSEGH